MARSCVGSCLWPLQFSSPCCPVSPLLFLQLRDLVPPSAAVKSPDGGDAKRPKHVVLSDTIALLRHLKEKVQQDELERQRLQLVQQQMAALGMVSAEAMAAGQQAHFPAGMMQAASNGMVPGVMSLPSAMEATTLSGAVSQSAQTLLQHSLSGSLSSYTAALPPAAAFGPSSCPELPQVCLVCTSCHLSAISLSCDPPRVLITCMRHLLYPLPAPQLCFTGPAGQEPHSLHPC
jgi:hypothetical protein